MNVYFAAAIRGGTDDMQYYASMIAHIKKYANVLTEHIGDPELLKQQWARLTKDEDVYQDDVALINKSHIVIADVTQPSLGVWYELAYAEAHQKPVHCLYRTTPEKKLSAMIRWNKYFHIYDYSTIEEALVHIDAIIAQYKQDLLTVL